ncbi:MAG TPA: HAD family phosphatase [Bacteroidota bacterium]|nr:HAD family phosphatase [Bacteroidota bacterium]
MSDPQGEVRAVIFDFGRVISDFDINRFIARIAPRSRLPEKELSHTSSLGTSVAVRYETGLISSDEFYREICSLAALTISREEFIEAYTDIFTPKPETFALVKALRGKYALGLLSNTNAWHYEYGIRPVEIFPLFDAVTLSFEVRAMKPDPLIYRDVLGKLRLPAGACVYIDDIQEYVDAGRALGLRAIRYTTHERLIADLSAAGVQIPPG